MKVSIDLDDTYLKYPEVFNPMIDMLKNSGHEVGILTGRMIKDVVGVIETGKFDFIITDEENYTVDGKFKLTMQEHAELWKSRMIREHGINIHWDDCADFIIRGGVAGAKVIKI